MECSHRDLLNLFWIDMQSINLKRSTEKQEKRKSADRASKSFAPCEMHETIMTSNGWWMWRWYSCCLRRSIIQLVFGFLITKPCNFKQLPDHCIDFVIKNIAYEIRSQFSLKASRLRGSHHAVWGWMRAMLAIDKLHLNEKTKENWRASIEEAKTRFLTISNSEPMLEWHLQRLRKTNCFWKNQCSLLLYVLYTPCEILSNRLNYFKEHRDRTSHHTSNENYQEKPGRNRWVT